MTTEEVLTEAENVKAWNRNNKIGDHYIWMSSCGTAEICRVSTVGMARLDANGRAVVECRERFKHTYCYIFLDQLKKEN